MQLCCSRQKTLSLCSRRPSCLMLIFDEQVSCVMGIRSSLKEFELNRIISPHEIRSLMTYFRVDWVDVAVISQKKSSIPWCAHDMFQTCWNCAWLRFQKRMDVSDIHDCNYRSFVSGSWSINKTLALLGVFSLKNIQRNELNFAAFIACRIQQPSCQGRNNSTDRMLSSGGRLFPVTLHCRSLFRC